ncbi:hypothetical protein FGF1_24070 [Flavobacteriaceae bacterium GF1]
MDRLAIDIIARRISFFIFLMFWDIPLIYDQKKQLDALFSFFYAPGKKKAANGSLSDSHNLGLWDNAWLV